METGKIKKRFESCPYNCNANGMIVDDNIGKMVQCPYCSKLKKDLIKSGELEAEGSEERKLTGEVLGIKNSKFLSDRFVYDSIIPDGEKFYIDADSLENQRKIADELYLSLSIGELPTRSICFGLSRVGDMEKFCFPMLTKAYQSGLSIGRLYTAREINEMFLAQTLKTTDLYDVDFLMIVYSEDSDNACAHTVQGVLQSRSMRGKPTIVVSTAKVEACSQFLGYWNNTSYSLATPVFAEYKANKKKGYSSYINKLLGVTNTNITAGDSNDEWKSTTNDVSSYSGLSMTMDELSNIKKG